MGCGPLSVAECEALVTPEENPWCFSEARADECYDEATTLGRVTLGNGTRGWCCREVSRECPPEE